MRTCLAEKIQPCRFNIRPVRILRLSYFCAGTKVPLDLPLRPDAAPGPTHSSHQIQSSRGTQCWQPPRRIPKAFGSAVLQGWWGSEAVSLRVNPRSLQLEDGDGLQILPRPVGSESYGESRVLCALVWELRNFFFTKMLSETQATKLQTHFWNWAFHTGSEECSVICKNQSTENFVPLFEIEIMGTSLYLSFLICKIGMILIHRIIGEIKHLKWHVKLLPLLLLLP